MSSTVGSLDEHRLEAPGQRRVLLDVLAVLVERGGADAVQLAARQRGLEHVGGVHRALGLAGADQRVQLVDEQDDLALGRGDLLRARAFSRSSNSPRYLAPATSAPRSSASRRLSFRLSGTSPLTMRSARPSTIAVLPTPGLADQHRVVLGPAREHLDRAPDLLVAADHRVELALARRRGQVARVLLRARRSPPRPRRCPPCGPCASPRSRAFSALRRDAGVAQRLGGGGALGQRQREQQPLDRDEANRRPSAPAARPARTAARVSGAM